MRRFQLRTKATAPAATPTLSIESMNIDQILTGRRVLSVEEEVVALAEADNLQNQVNQDVAETVRVEDVTDVMLNVADTVESTQVVDPADENATPAEITPAQAMLVDTVSEMAVAGTDGDPDDVIETAEPLLEGTPEEKAVAVEAFVENIRKRAAEIWEKIRKFCLEIWSTIKEYFSRIFQAAPRLLHRVKELRDFVATAKKSGGDSPKSGEIMVLVGTTSISYPDYQVRDTKELLKGLGELKTLANYAGGNYLNDAKYMGEAVAVQLKKFDPKKAAEHLNAVAKALPKNNFDGLPANPPTGYLGCFEVVAHRVDKNKIKDLSDAQVVGALRNSGVKVQHRAGKQSMINTKNAFATMNWSEMEQTLSAVEGLVKQMMAVEKSSAMTGIEKAREELIAGGNHASQTMAKFEGNDDAGKMERAYAMDVMKSLMNFNTSLTRWMSEMTMPVSKKIYQTSRVALTLVENSLRQYKSVASPAPAAV